MNIYRDGTVRKLKDGLSKDQISAYFDRHPGAVECDSIPDMEALNEMAMDGICEAIDGCMVEPDGHCQHNLPSWLLALGCI